jgi:flagellar biosynthesis GTPase FlhF
MTNLATETKTYFGESLEEVLPQIRTELGPDALIVRQREGVLGGIGGFFGRKCIEVDARPAVIQKVPTMPSRAVVDAYDTGPETYEPEETFQPFESMFTSTFGSQPEPEEAPSRPTNGLEAMLAQSAPFATALSNALTAEPVMPAAPAAPPEPPPAPQPAQAAPTPPPAAPAQPISEDEVTVLRNELIGASLSSKIVDEILSEARFSLRPFDPDTPMRELVRRALIRRIPIVRPASSERSMIAVIGVSASGRTLAAASLCAAYAQTGRSVAAMSLEPALEAIRLAGLLRELDVQFEVASAPEVVSLIRSSLDEAEVIVADVPPILDNLDPGRLAKTIKLLESFRPDETHLVLPAYMSASDAKKIIEALAPHALPTRLIITHSDDELQTGAAVGLAVSHSIPVSFVSCGPSLGSLRPAEAEPLAKMVLK